MAANEIVIYEGTLGTSSATLGTVPTGKKWIITEIWLANKTGAAVTATITRNGLKLVPAKSIPANDALRIPCNTVVTADQVVAGLAGTAAAIDCVISGVEVG